MIPTRTLRTRPGWTRSDKVIKCPNPETVSRSYPTAMQFSIVPPVSQVRLLFDAGCQVVQFLINLIILLMCLQLKKLITLMLIMGLHLAKKNSDLRLFPCLDIFVLNFQFFIWKIFVWKDITKADVDDDALQFCAWTVSDTRSIGHNTEQCSSWIVPSTHQSKWSFHWKPRSRVKSPRSKFQIQKNTTTQWRVIRVRLRWRCMTKMKSTISSMLLPAIHEINNIKYLSS